MQPDVCGIISMIKTDVPPTPVRRAVRILRDGKPRERRKERRERKGDFRIPDRAKNSARLSAAKLTARRRSNQFETRENILKEKNRKI